jgi:DNA-binding response OmpR family regulator
MQKQILLVEDTTDLRMSIAELLRMEAYDVIETSNGEDALLLLETMKPQLIITDLLMPRMSGFDFIQSVRKNKQWNNVPILVFSAMPVHENEKRVLELGATAYHKKPSTLDALLDEITNLINSQQQS